MEVEALWKKNYQVEVRARQFSVNVDEAPEFHGEDTGMMPTELFLCSLASCFCLAIVYVARKKRIEIKDLTVKVKGEKDLENFLFSKILVCVFSSLPLGVMEDLLGLAKRYCFVSNTIINSCPIEYSIGNKGEGNCL
ncbi:MAG: hypothetical protein KatS3mg078_0317 [Deltaproteobacteria bacterium]|jgi:putative redox protein|nr:MAG: hypothetical protein KatS3mg078_0317 [Deltaproteobacteria bacterium]